MIEGKKYIVWPGFVRSRKDGQWHHISSRDLMRLFRVAPHDCVIAPPESDSGPQARRKRDQLRTITGLIHLCPMSNGDYTIPKA